MKKELTVLYAEDDRETQENYEIILKKYFKNVYLAGDGKEAFDIYDYKAPDVVILDISMPIMDGLEVAQKIRENDKNTTILMFTAHSQRDRLLQAVNLHLDEYILKPVDIEKFQDILIRLNEELRADGVVKLEHGFSWDINKGELFYKNNPVKLTKKEAQITKLLCENPDMYFSMDDISEVLWEEKVQVEHQNRIKQLISRYKQKISKICSQPDSLVENSYSRGYKIRLA